MIRRPVQLANAKSGFAPADPPDLSAVGLDIATAVRTVEGQHADADLFVRALAAGLAAAGREPDAGRRAGTRADAVTAVGREHVLDLVALAAWRAGALALRADALSRLERILADPVPPHSAAAALGIDARGLAEFARRQRTDRYWWPGRSAARGYVLAAGGFRGFGGAWIRPAERAVALPDAGAFGFLVAGEWWRLDCDVWGARLAASDVTPDAVPMDEGVTVVIAPDTHLAWLHVRDAE